MSSASGLCFHHVPVNGVLPVLPQSPVPGTCKENVLCKLPVDVARKVLSSFLDLVDIVQLDSAALVHTYRESLQQMYLGAIFTNTMMLKIDSSTVEWLKSRTVYVQRMKISQRMVAKWRASFDVMMSQVVGVDIEPETALFSSRMNSIFANCRQLTSLDLQGCTFAADALQAVPSMCPLLQKVNLACSNVDIRVISPLLSSRIVSLDLSHCPLVDDIAVLAVISAYIHLQSFNLNDCKLCTGTALEAIARNCPLLQELYLEGWTNLPDDSMMALAAGCRELRVLHLSINHTLTSAGVLAIAAHCTKLVNVTLSRCQNVSSSALVALVSSCPELRVVNIQADDAVVMALSQHCPHLTDGLCVNGESVAALLSHCQELRSLRVSDFSFLPPCCDGITSSVHVLSLALRSRNFHATVSSLLQYMPHLRELHVLGGSWILTDALVLAVARHCPLLEQAHLSGLMRLTDVSIIALAEHCPLLRKINLSGCTLLTDAAVIAIAQHGPLLRKINLSGCTLLTDATVIAIAQRCPQLTHFNLVNYPVHASTFISTFDEDSYPETAISDASIAALAAHSHRLRELNVHGHALISEAALTARTAALPRCTVNTTKHER